jgi:hypothetical protein
MDEVELNHCPKCGLPRSGPDWLSQLLYPSRFGPDLCWSLQLRDAFIQTDKCREREAARQRPAGDQPALNNPQGGLP